MYYYVYLFNLKKIYIKKINNFKKYLLKPNKKKISIQKLYNKIN